MLELRNNNYDLNKQIEILKNKLAKSSLQNEK